MSEVFQSDVFHMGGDEVKMKCWNEDANITDWLIAHNYGTDQAAYMRLWSYFQNRSLEKLDEAFGRQQPVVLWTSALTQGKYAAQYLDPGRYIIQFWDVAKDRSIADLYKQGYKLIMSNYDSLYLDCGYGSWIGDSPNNWCSPYIGWQQIYENSPKKIIEHFKLEYKRAQFLGGEAALWTEQVSLSN